MTMMRWDPFGEALSLRQAMDRLLEDAVVEPARSQGARGGGQSLGFAMDVMEQSDGLVVRASLPGVKPEDVDISIEENVLTIQGETRDEHEDGGQQSGGAAPSTRAGQEGQSSAGHQNGQTQQAGAPIGQQGAPQSSQTGRGQTRYHQREHRYGRFLRQVMLPVAVDANKAEATFEHGVLTLRLPKAEQARRHTISISGQGASSKAIEGQRGESTIGGTSSKAQASEPSLSRA